MAEHPQVAVGCELQKRLNLNPLPLLPITTVTTKLDASAAYPQTLVPPLHGGQKPVLKSVE